ncbi:hypothetical protein NMY3_02115 [Candidatus Nitrosocosmicus oleophilus]|uniref:Uncharacterized protein n=1 Tax=Candidatus Nitrosocosmicus oleophilus TaxID=1353260 RepID=A0A654M0U5_9ARCH|nr:hypothetical protein [Candidatus Nitrosocosmicus oleophilus]ALI36316.1 hypothetical protein NMY3_02115 [Candidatus Nitrosocosmicus oleophilus]
MGAFSATSNHKSVNALSSPSFELQEMINENHDWFQTYGNSDLNLKNNYTDILAVNYLSDGETLNATLWLNAGISNYTDFSYKKPLNKVSYGMLIDADSNSETGYRGADYDFYVELTGGHLSAYIYQLSSTGGYKLIGSNTNFTEVYDESGAYLGSVDFTLDLDTINNPGNYNLLFYSAESLGSNEVRQFTNWVSIPPPTLQVTTSPEDISIRQGENMMVPARIKSSTGFSNDVVNITLSGDKNSEYAIASGFNSSEIVVNVERIQPPLFKIDIPKETPLGIYSIPLIVTIREPSEAVITKPISVDSYGGKVDPEVEISKKYPTVGYLTKPINLTVTVIAPKTINDHFKEFWGTYGSFIGIFAGAFIGAFAKVLFDKRKKES